MNFNLLNSHRLDFPEAFAALEEWQRDATARRARFAQKQPPLSIGVMGQIKAGKSSFLNQLLFGGQPLLPEAATPKTANLTRIRHAEAPCFTAHFYSPISWSDMEQLAASEAQDVAACAARELVQQARRDHGTGIAAMLAQGKVELHADNIDELLGRINDYVGAEGRFTPLVESSELALPLPELDGVEIVDTPGMNDPVSSRTNKTRAYMAQCDVVFYLSRAGQLLDDNDQQLLAAQLPAKGVKRLVVVAAQFDAAIHNDGFDRNSLNDCETYLRQRLSDHAQRNLERLAAEREKQGFPNVAALLRGIGTPLFASTYAQALASLPPQQWSTGQRHTHQMFAELAEDAWGGVAPNAADWRRIGGFAALEAALSQARADKDTILATQRVKLEEELSRSLAHLLANLRDQASERVAFLQTHDMADLDAHASKANKRLQAIADTLTGYVRGQSNAARTQARRILSDLQQAAGRARNLEDRTGQDTQRRSVEVSDSKWYNPFSWGSSHTESYTETTTYRYLAVADALENLRNYFEDSSRRLLDLFDEMIAPDALSAGLRRELLGVLDTRSDDFDPRGLRALIETTLARLPWPELDIEALQPGEALAGFSGDLRGSGEMAALREQLAQVVSELQQTLAERLNRAVQQVCTQLDTLAGQLQEALTQSLAADLDRLRTALADKAGQVERLQGLVKEIDAGVQSAAEQTNLPT
ncbi:dynamin family protein [Rhodoferax antarcticus]|uniref:dynamin family protein n=1 Tax=Rhodoferax antarcticus TaxID=81479 RepID=UPI002224D291|nr:dynamin family protein [Rhodoferax antarcticus]MCW2313542.1 ElaB/YqjD/DUF883 family membrane-anchored ribosome-binding protein [Rhodoferax antarcticus]